MRELGPGATSSLGSTGGVTDDGRFIVLARFESEEAARRNSDRPEQRQWWAETAKTLDGPATFHDSTDVTLDTPGDPDRAGFVPVMRRRSASIVDTSRSRPSSTRVLTISHDELHVRTEELFATAAVLIATATDKRGTRSYLFITRAGRRSAA